MTVQISAKLSDFICEYLRNYPANFIYKNNSYGETLNLVLPRDAQQCKARSCYRMSSVCSSATSVDHDHIGGQESLANAKVNARQHCVVVTYGLTETLVTPSGEAYDNVPCCSLQNTRNHAKFDLTAVQGHPRSLIEVSMESPYVTSH